MNKITIIIVSGLLVSGIIFVLLTRKINTPASKSQLPPTKTVSSQPQLKTYANDSGFSFKYPESFTLSEKEVEDESSYAWVELTNPKNKDVISIKLDDSDFEEVDDWFTASNKKDIEGEIKKVRLADLDGRQFTNKKNQTTTLALDEGGVLISILGNPSTVHQQIVSSFIFTQSAQTTTTDTSSAEDIIFEGEEVIE